ncbi:MAG: prolyl aminopeptidase [Bdellovibrionales bacterium CG10_big_fil_rev_8_21_14_0_10_45_34]|nr:MAG: prolyl aminopeptidase [Bdellovibrionales bacterium CG10_big_fil_rev_8_21_14_0_10_45_34]
MAQVNQPFNTFRLKVSEIHELYVEEVGNPSGVPIVFLHGGPGAGCNEHHRELFDPKIFRAVLFDQRGCGRSTPHASLEQNTTWDLVADIERIRDHLKIDKWIVFGGSWGSTLGLAYAESHSERCKALILRGIFLCRPEEIEWFYQYGAHQVFPDFFQPYQDFIPASERDNYLKAYYKRLNSADEKVRLEAAKCWSIWEGSTAKLLPDEKTISEFGSDHMALSLARIENHYFVNGCFFRTPNQLLEDAHKISNVPGVIVHGRYDMVCPIKNAFDLHKVWPNADFHVIPDAGHAVTEPGIQKALKESLRKYY